MERATICGRLPAVNLPVAFGGDGSADGGERADEDAAALAERMSPRSIMSDEVRHGSLMVRLKSHQNAVMSLP